MNLAKILTHTKSPAQMQKLLETLLTSKELVEIDQRIAILQMLDAHIPQHTIAQKLGVGVATVSRGAKVSASDSYQKIKTLLC